METKNNEIIMENGNDRARQNETPAEPVKEESSRGDGDARAAVSALSSLRSLWSM